MCYSSPNMQVLTTAPFPSPQVASRLHAEALWRLGYTGKGVHVAVFDTGLGHGLPQLAVEERTNWTDEEDSDDKVGHGTFVASVIGSRSACLGLAPDASLHIYKVFNSKQVSVNVKVSAPVGAECACGSELQGMLICACSSVNAHL